MPVWASSGEREKNKQIRVHVQLKIAQLGNQIRFPGKKIAKKGPVKNREISDMWVFKGPLKFPPNDRYRSGQKFLK